MKKLKISPTVDKIILKMIPNFQSFSLTAIFLQVALFCNSQNVFDSLATGKAMNDSLTYGKIVEYVISRNPQIKEAEELSNGTQWKEKFSKSSYLPSVSASANVSKIYPLQTFDLGATSLQMVPDYAFDAGIRFNQLIYDFGKTGKDIEISKANTELSQINIDNMKQQLALQTAQSFYSLLYVQSALDIKKEELSTLQQHLDFIQKRRSTGSATQYEVLVTKVKIASTETQLKDFEAQHQVLLSNLNKMMDTTNFLFNVKRNIEEEKYVTSMDSLFKFAIQNREDAKSILKKEDIAQLNYKLAGAQYLPTLQLTGSVGYKNGYLPDVNEIRFNYVIGLTLNIPIFERNRKYISKQIAQSSVIELDYNKKNIINSIVDEITECNVSIDLAIQKINRTRAQLTQATEAYKQAIVNYDAGVITNLDLLDASNALSETKLQLLRAQIDYQFAILKLKATIGERLY
jgi:outer membrane protein TolC